MHGGSSVVPGALFLHRRLPEIVGVEEGHRDGATPGEDGRKEVAADASDVEQRHEVEAHVVLSQARGCADCRRAQHELVQRDGHDLLLARAAAGVKHERGAVLIAVRGRVGPGARAARGGAVHVARD